MPSGCHLPPATCHVPPLSHQLTSAPPPVRPSIHPSSRHASSSPFAFAGPARITRCPTNVAQIAATPGAWPDVLVLSHNHYDHTDVNTLSELLAHADPSHDRPVPHVFCSLGTKSWFTALGYPTDGVTELDWWDARVLERDDGTRVRFTAVPAQHFSSRGIHDRNKTLWSGFVMEVLQHEDRPTAKVYFAGDVRTESSASAGRGSAQCSGAGAGLRPG